MRLVALLLIIALLAAFSSCTKPGDPDSDDPANPGDSAEPIGSDDPGWEVVPPDVTQETQHSDKPTPDVTSPPPEKSGPDVPLADAADDSFFEDAAFMGNSLMDGFRMFSGLTTCDYYAATSMTVTGATSVNCVALDNGNQGTMIDGLTQKEYGKIYILLGINEIGMDVSYFTDLYGQMLDILIDAQPDCDIYIMGLTPVSYLKSSSHESFNMTRITTYNEALYQLAADKGCYYLDLVEALSDSSGYLPAEETSDGIHFSAGLYQKWLEYVKTHYV